MPTLQANCPGSMVQWDALQRSASGYPSVQAVRMGRLAVDLDFKGLGLGGALLADALDRTIRSDIAAYALVVDAKDESAAAFYRHHGLIALPDQPMTLFVPLATARNAGAAGGGARVGNSGSIPI